jgi:two-component system, sensor histidine kinase SagS
MDRIVADESGKLMLVFADDDEATQTLRALAPQGFEVAGLFSDASRTGNPDVVAIGSPSARRVGDLKVAVSGFLDGLPDGVALLDRDRRILWHNRQFSSLTGNNSSLVGRTLVEAIGALEVSGGDLARLPLPPDTTSVRRLRARVGDRKWIGLRARRCCLQGASLDVQDSIAVTVRDISAEIAERQKQMAIYYAGLELGNLTAEEVTGMHQEDRLTLLKESILQSTQDILGYDTFEIRLLNPDTQQLRPLLEFGMDPIAATRTLYARPEDNGVTGFVAHTAKSYLCSDAQTDPLYIRGASAARSSLTIPLLLADIVLGTFNVESPRTLSFDHRDLEFLQLFGRVIANALNQLQLLAAEKVCSVTENVARMRHELAEPTDEILSSATWILERYIGHEPDVCERLQRIVNLTRQISGKLDTPSHSDHQFGPLVAPVVNRDPRPKLVGKRVLVIDGDRSVREEAHKLLGEMGCVVEAVKTGTEGCSMVRTHHYDVVLSDIRLADMNGYDCFSLVRKINTHVPIILTTGFGYDPTHAIVNARKEGLKAVLYKPFRRGQMLDEIEKAVTPPPPCD